MVSNPISERLNFLKLVVNWSLSKSGRSVRKNLQKIHTATSERNAIE